MFVPTYIFLEHTWFDWFCRSSDSPYTSAFPTTVSGNRFDVLSKGIQQRDCSGFSPDSLFIHSPQTGHLKQNWGKGND